MPTSRSALQGQVDDLEETVQHVADLAQEGLDPELSREEVIAKLKEIQEAVSEESDENDPEGEE
jgi:argininosuccinate lyase